MLVSQLHKNLVPHIFLYHKYMLILQWIVFMHDQRLQLLMRLIVNPTFVVNKD